MAEQTAVPPTLSRRERWIKKMVVFVVRLLYRDVDVYQAPLATAAGPQLGVANHFGGFADPMLLIYAMDRVPRFIARDIIWRIPLVRGLMNWAGAIPVHRAEDKGPASNDEMFRSTYRALDSRDLLVIFPEGIAHDDPAIAGVKTGAARIALGARAQGTSGIEIVPAGIHYEDKAALRSKVFINISRPLDLDAGIGRYVDAGQAEDASNHEAVRRLTADVDTVLRQAAPDFADWQEARTLSQAAEVFIRSSRNPRESVTYGERERLSNVLARRPDAAKATIVEATHTYRRELDALGLADTNLARNRYAGGSFVGYLLRGLLLALLLLPFAVVGLIINFLPLMLVKLVGQLRVAAATMATIKPLVAILAFALTWAFWSWVGWNAAEALGLDPIAGVAGVLLLMPFYIASLILFGERIVLLGRVLRDWRARRARRAEDLENSLRAARQGVIDAVTAAL